SAWRSDPCGGAIELRRCFETLAPAHLARCGRRAGSRKRTTTSANGINSRHDYSHAHTRKRQDSLVDSVGSSAAAAGVWEAGVGGQLRAPGRAVRHDLVET